MTFARKIKRVLAAVLTVIMIAAVIPVASSAATGDTKEIYNFLVSKMGLNSAAACGVLANIECESDFNYNLYGDNGTSYGICQWHNERLTNMKNYCAKNDLDWTSLEGQLYFLKYELNTNKSDTGYIIDKLKDVANTANGAYDAAYDWCYYFERPANKESKSNSRGNLAKNTYWPKFGNMPVEESAPAYLPGDVDKNGKINSSDALMIVEKAVGSRTLTSEQTKAADINRDGCVGSADALIVLNISAGADSVKNYQ